MRQEGYIKLDRRHGAIISLNEDKLRAMQELGDEMRVIVAKAVCKNISPDEIHAMVDEVINEITGE